MKKHMVRGIHKIKKGGHAGDEMWRTHRLEGVVKNRGIKPVKKKKKGE
jgi:hypothetical protein